MAQVNPLTREVLVKLVYYGPGLGGKTTSLSHVHATAPPETRGELVSLATPVDRTLYFDFLPVRLSTVRGHGVRLQLFTVPGQVYFDQTRRLVLTGADGVVFVGDSQVARRDANVESFENLVQNLASQGRRLGEVPHVLQYNKRDLPDILSIEEMDAALNPHGAPAFATSALHGRGVVDTLDALVRRVLEDLDARRVFGTPGESLPDVRLGRADVALEEQVSRATERMWRPGTLTTPTPAAAFRSSPAQPTPGMQDAPPSWIGLFGTHAEDARRVERSISAGRFADAIVAAERLVSAVLAEAASDAAMDGASEETLVLLLGLEGNRWLAFRRILRRAHEGGPLNDRDALEAYAMAIDLRLRSSRIF